MKQLSGHLRPEIVRAHSNGPVDDSTVMTLILGLSLRNKASLDALINDVSDPNSTSYRRYLTPDEFADQFGASTTDYAKVVTWAQAHNFAVTTYRNRLAAQISATVADINAALHVRMHYGSRSDGSQFYAPDVEPSVDRDVPIEHISELENYNLPVRDADGGGGGSGLNGARTGADFRNAYASCTNMTGAGQSIGIVQPANNGYSQNDVDNFFSYTSMSTMVASLGITPLPVQVNGTPITSVGLEGTGDVQMALAMAPAAQVIVFTGGFDTMLQNMANATNIKQFSTSWSWWPIDSTAQNAIAQFAAQGQSFFAASGDNANPATGCINWPQSDDRFQPAITLVGGTALTLTGSYPKSWVSESPWFASLSAASTGGVACYQGGGESLPAYQYKLANSSNGGSTTYRNVPDVAMEAANVSFFVNSAPHAGAGALQNAFGTSWATPLWAGYIALVNQAAASIGAASVGFANNAIYSLGVSQAAYSSYFHDIVGSTQSGYNQAVAGYDLVTGLGSPQCALINNLSGYSYCGTSNTISPTTSYGPPGTWAMVQGTKTLGQFRTPVVLFGNLHWKFVNVTTCP